MKNLIGYSILAVCLIWLCGVSSAQCLIDEVLKKENAIWEITSDDLAGLFPGKKLFQWADVSKTEFKYPADVKPEKMTFLGMPVAEAVFNFKNDKLAKFHLSLLSRKDAGDIQKSDNDELLKSMNDALETLTGKKADGEPVLIAGGKKTYSRNWHCKDYFLELKWSYAGIAGKSLRVEFLTLNVSPPLKEPDGKSIRTLTRKTLAEKVKGNNEGDRYLEIPVIAQKQPGQDMVVAVSCQLLNYYGLKTDRKMKDGLFRASSGGGLADIESTLKDCAAATGLKYSKLYLNNDMSNVRNFDKMISQYNAEARKAKTQYLVMQKYIKSNGMRTAYNLQGVVAAMDPAIYKKVRLKDNINFKEFQKDIIDNIDSGIPVIWGAKLGIIKEENIPQRYAVILRLINGYNEKEGRVIYTDYWDENHANKNMSWEDAWTVTFFTGLLTRKTEK